MTWADKLAKWSRKKQLHDKVHVQIKSWRKTWISRINCCSGYHTEDTAVLTGHINKSVFLCLFWVVNSQNDCANKLAQVRQREAVQFAKHPQMVKCTPNYTVKKIASHLHVVKWGNMHTFGAKLAPRYANEPHTSANSHTRKIISVFRKSQWDIIIKRLSTI